MNLVITETQLSSDHQSDSASKGLMLSVAQLPAAAYRDGVPPRVKVEAARPAVPPDNSFFQILRRKTVSRRIFENVIAPIGIDDFFSYYWAPGFAM